MLPISWDLCDVTLSLCMLAIHFRDLVGSRILLAREIQGGLAVLCLPTESWEKCFWVVDTLFIFSLSYGTKEKKIDFLTYLLLSGVGSYDGRSAGSVTGYRTACSAAFSVGSRSSS